MVIHTRQKGYRTLQKAREHYQREGWLFEAVEKTGKYIANKDCFGLFDAILIQNGQVLFLQVKTNRKPKESDFVAFARQYGGLAIKVEAYCWYDRKGAIIIRYHTNPVETLDLRV